MENVQTEVSAADLELMETAKRRYCRSGPRSTDGVYEEPGRETIVEHDGKRYVVLSNVNRALAVYLITSPSTMRRLQKWPGEVAWDDC